MNIKHSAIATLLLALAAAPAMGQDATTAAPPPETPSAASAPQTAVPPPLVVQGPRVMLETSLGNITLVLDAVHAPVTVKNFLRYAREHHFDGTVFYRVVPGFVIQAGSYDADGKPRRVHAPIAFEANNGLKNLRGSIAMAHGDDPASATAEFFIDLADAASLDQQQADTANTTGFTVFGSVADGMDVVDQIAKVPLGGKGPFPGAAPLSPVTIIKAEVLPAT